MFNGTSGMRHKEQTTLQLLKVSACMFLYEILNAYKLWLIFRLVEMQGHAPPTWTKHINGSLSRPKSETSQSQLARDLRSTFETNGIKIIPVQGFTNSTCNQNGTTAIYAHLHTLS